MAEPWNVDIHYDSMLDGCVHTELPGARLSLLPLGRVFIECNAPG